MHMLLVILVTTFKGRAFHHYCILATCLFSFSHFGFVGRMLALTELVPGHCFDFTKIISQNGNNMSRRTQTNSN